MNDITHPTTTDEGRLQLATEAVIAAYIHEISTRHDAAKRLKLPAQIQAQRHSRRLLLWTNTGSAAPLARSAA
jgi:hypothetical protein